MTCDCQGAAHLVVHSFRHSFHGFLVSHFDQNQLTGGTSSIRLLTGEEFDTVVGEVEKAS